MTDDELIRLIKELTAHRKETEWVEFKCNRIRPEEIGEYISALSNSAALLGKEAAYIVWGIDNGTLDVVGTDFKPRVEKIGNEELENWLATQLNPRIGFDIYEFSDEGMNFVIFKIQPASTIPVGFKGVRYIRIGSYKKRLREHPAKESELWRLFEQTHFEDGNAAIDVSSDELLTLIDYPNYFYLTGQPLPDNRDGIIDKLLSEGFVLRKPGGFYDITNYGAILFAKELRKFERLAEKALRIIFYESKGKFNIILEREQVQGYAVEFEDLMRFINERLPQYETINGAFREKVTTFPEIAIRELVANALIHQDFTISGTGPKVEVFVNRIEITNPGTPLIDTKRFVDYPPKSRNKKIASFMRRIGICEEIGTGIDKVLQQVELSQLPAPDFIALQDHTQVVLYAHKELSEMSTDEKTRACYLHACLFYVLREKITNSSLRKRFKMSDKNYSVASKIIKETIDADLIKRADTGSKSSRDAKYIPYWA